MDGAFFEAFATVDEKQKGSIKKAKQETKRQIETLAGKDLTDGYAGFYKLFPRDSFTPAQVSLLFYSETGTVQDNTNRKT